MSEISKFVNMHQMKARAGKTHSYFDIRGQHNECRRH